MPSTLDTISRRNPWARTLLRSITLVPILLLFVPAGNATPRGLEVPKDESWPLAKYVKHGVPDPGRPWTVEDYVSGLRSLSNLEREHLPRAASPQSGVLFERLLSMRMQVPEIVPEKAGVPPLSHVYSAAKKDRLLFDRELVAIKAEVLRQLVSNAPTGAELEEAGAAAAKLYGNSDRQPGELAQQLSSYQDLLRQSSASIRRRTGDLLYIATLPELTDGARRELVTRLGEILPMTQQRLVDGDREWLFEEIRGLGRLEFNSSIREELVDLATVLDHDS